MLTRDEQQNFVLSLTMSIAQDLRTAIKRGDIPKEWDGHELREALAMMFDRERTRLMRERGKRRKAFLNTYYQLPRT